MEFLTEMLPHQRAAVEKLSGFRVGALFMEMGTGKTRTALELAARRLDSGRIRRVLWLCPCSLHRTGAIAAEVARHCPSMSGAVTIRGIESLSGSDRLFLELRELCESEPTMLVVDESLLVKTARAKRTERVKALSQLCRYRLLLNGTPVSRSAADLFAQWDVLDWRILGFRSWHSFASRHVVYDEKRPGVFHTRHEDELTGKIAPYTYQVRKSECVELPPKLYRTECFRMDGGQAEHYAETYEAFLDAAWEGFERGESAGVYRLLTAAQLVASGRRIVSGVSEPMESVTFFQRWEDDPRASAAVRVLGESDGQAVVWCRYRHEADTLMEALACRFGQGSAARFDGAVAGRARTGALEGFASGRVRFLVANKACGGFGLNLQFCRRMLFYSNDWNWGTRAQAEDRCHRIGQTGQLEVVDLCADGTMDSRILVSLSRKENVCDGLKRELKRIRDELREGRHADLKEARNAKDIS